MKILEDNWIKQDANLDLEIISSRKELQIKENELKNIENKSEIDRVNADKVRNKIQDINKQINELNENKATLEKSRIELNKIIEDVNKELGRC